MENKKLRSARSMIKTAVITRLIGNALLSLWTAAGYSEIKDNLLRIDSGAVILPYIIAALFADTFLTVLWLKNKLFHTIHLGLYIALYGFGYCFMIIDVMNLRSRAILAAFVLALFIWAAGLIPFIVCGIGRRKQTKALNGDDNSELSHDHRIKRS